MTAGTKPDVYAFLKARRSDFITLWAKASNDAFAAHLSTGEKGNLVISPEELAPVFDAYLEESFREGDLVSNQLVLDLVDRNPGNSHSLSALEILNTTFMTAAREITLQAYPDSLDSRRDYLEPLSECVLNNEISLARHYEEKLNVLHNELHEKADSLKRRNDTLVEFLDLATHELQSPLWSILGFAAKLHKMYDDKLDDQGRHCLDRISANVAEMHTLIEDVAALLTIDRDNLARKPVRLFFLLQEVAARVRREIDESFTSKFEGVDDLEIQGDPRRLKQMFYQIVKNAAIYKPANISGRLLVRVSRKEPGTLHLYFEDEGIGIEPRYLRQVFRPMERLKEIDVPGSGMGLTFARRVVEAHGGAMEIEEGRTRGVRVHIQLPGKQNSNYTSQKEISE